MKNTNPKESKHHISKPLQLNSVPQSEDKLDSVLVRGADKIVKHVPRSQFSNGSTQTLQQVLDNGNILSSNSVIAFPSTSIFSGNISMSSSTFNNQMDITGNILENNDDNSRFEANSDKIKFVNSTQSGGLVFVPTYGTSGATYTNATNPVNGGGVKHVIPLSVNSVVPDSLTGNIDLQIDLQTIINNRNRATGEFTIDSQNLISNTRFLGGAILFEDNGSQGNISASGLTQSYMDEVLRIGNGSISFDWDNGDKRSQLSLRNLQSGYLHVGFPYKASGSYTLMYRQDLATYNPTTINLSLTELDNSYPDAIPGFRVHCNSISSGALIYENTSAGWLQIAASIV